MINSVSNNKTCVLILHFGSLPKWFDLWKYTAKLNPEIDFLIFQDDRETVREENIYLIRDSLEGINALPRMKAQGWHVDSFYKLCDLRPALAYILEDKIQNYTYWGWGDLDVFYGNILSVLGDSFGKYDYIATGRDGQSGPLAFLRNSPEINSLWRKIDMHSIINDAENHYAADEVAFLDLLKENASCDINFRECLDDLPAQWTNGHLIGRNGREHALFHFGGRLKHSQKQIGDASDNIIQGMRKTGGFEILQNYRIVHLTRNPAITFSKTFYFNLRRSLARFHKSMVQS